MADISNIDELLMGGSSAQTPATPESQYEAYEDSAEVADNGLDEPQDLPDYGNNDLQDDHANDSIDDHDSSPESHDEHREEERKETKEVDYDDYGNAKEAPRTYTQEEVDEKINKAIRERLARGNNSQQQPTQQQVQQATQDFQYNPESNDSPEVQLEKFIELTVSRMTQKQQQQAQQAREQQAQIEFETKFTQGMDRFKDFREVVSAQPISDPMTYALRGMKDPAAFIYAASKRNPQELQRISSIQDPYAQMVEMGKLEERMRKAPPQSRAPKPVSRTRDDAPMPVKEKSKEPTIEDLIAKADAKRRAQLTSRRGRG